MAIYKITENDINPILNCLMECQAKTVMPGILAIQAILNRGSEKEEAPKVEEPKKEEAPTVVE